MEGPRLSALPVSVSASLALPGLVATRDLGPGCPRTSAATVVPWPLPPRSPCSCSTTTRSSGAGCGTCSRPSRTSRSSARRAPRRRRWPAIPPLRPDVAVLDVRLPDGDGVTVCRELRSQMPELACLMLTSFSDDEALVRRDHGRRRRATSSSRSAVTTSSTRCARSPAGGSLLDPRVTAQVLERLRGGAGRGRPRWWG